MATPGFFFIVEPAELGRDDVTNNLFALQISTRRKEMKLSMRGLAHATGIAASTISRIESGKLSPTLDNVLKIAAVLQLEPPLAEINQNGTSTGSKFAEDHPTQIDHELITYRRIATTVLKAGVRRDVSKIAARNGFTTAVLLRGVIELRSSTGLRERLTRGATVNCRLIARHEFYVIAIQEAELIWMG